MLSLTLTQVFTNMLPVTVEKLHTIYLQCGGVVCTDTRNIVPGSLFFCLKGGNFDGNLFAAEALLKGAAFVVADNKDVVADERYCFVEDTLTALQSLSHFHRKTLPSKILGIGGSNGKTTTKELTLRVLGSFLKTKATAGNLNNHIGVPLTLLSLTREDEVGIIEMGTNHPGEMKVLCELAAPDIGIVTNVGKEHLEGFKNLEAVAREESEVYLNLLQHDGFALVNADDTWLANMAKRLTHKLSYGIADDNCDLHAEIIHSMPNLQFNLIYQQQLYGPFTAGIGGRYNMYNILAAVGAGLALGGDILSCVAAACEYVPANNRSEWKNTPNRSIWLDAYNANPSSVEAAMRSFAEMDQGGCVILGDMLELGEHSESEHRAMLELAISMGFDELFVCGPEFKKVAGNFPNAFATTTELKAWFANSAPKSRYVLIKGSRGMRMETLIEELA